MKVNFSTARQDKEFKYNNDKKNLHALIYTYTYITIKC